MLKNKLFVASLLAFCCLAASFGADKYDKPRDKEVVIVGRVILDPPEDLRFYSRYWFMDSRNINMKTDKSVKEGDAIASSAYMVLDNSGFMPKAIGTDNTAEFMSGKVTIPKDRVITIMRFAYYLAGLDLFGLYLPAYVSFTVPDNVNYVYVGTIKYTRKGNQFEIVNAERLDEFDAAMAAVKERYGADAKLVRVPLTDLKEDEKK